MTAPVSEIKTAARAIRLLKTLHALTVDACQASSRANFIFRVLNDTVQLVRYDRAALWSFIGKTPVFLGASGHTDLDAHTPLISTWRNLVGSIPDPGTARALTAKDVPGKEDLWQEAQQQAKELSVVWLPILLRGELVGGLWLERWSDSAWEEDEQTILCSLMRSYAAGWEKYGLHRSWRARLAGLRRDRRFTIGAPIAFLLLFLWPVRLRVVAPCEVVPKRPIVITAPLNGVIERVMVDQGEPVTEGELLFTYDKRIPLEELKVVKQKVQVIESRLTRAFSHSFNDPTAKEELTTLQHRLQQERIRLQLAKEQIEKMDVPSPAAGAAMVTRPYEWSGRAVRVGERVMTVVDPGLLISRCGCYSMSAPQENLSRAFERRISHTTP